jgi:signal transduction histidine kinase
MNTFNVSFNDKVYKDQFITALAHDVRNPLANIGLSVDMLLSTPKEDSATMYLNIIKRNTARISKLITQLLTDEYNKEQDSNDYTLDQLVDEALLQVEDSIKLKAIKVEKNTQLKIVPYP